MAKLQETFIGFINEGAASAKRITEPDKKAMAYAALAQAIADSHLMIDTLGSTAVEEIKETGKDSLKEESGKGTKSSKTKTSAKKEVKEEAPVVPEVEESLPEVTEETIPEVEAPAVQEDTSEMLDEEWTEAMQTLKAEQLEILQSYIDAWSNEFVCGECLGRFFEDSTIKEDQLWDYLRPMNIDGFIAYLQGLSE